MVYVGILRGNYVGMAKNELCCFTWGLRGKNAIKKEGELIPSLIARGGRVDTPVV